MLPSDRRARRARPRRRPSRPRSVSSPEKIAHAIGIAGSLASGIIEYLADGSWTKRLHAGSSAQSGIRAALLAEAGFTGPKTVLEGSHGFYKAFAPSKTPNFSPLLEGLGTRFVLETIAFKPYACGTMTQPFIDCAIELRRIGHQARRHRHRWSAMWARAPCTGCGSRSR